MSSNAIITFHLEWFIYLLTVDLNTSFKIQKNLVPTLIYNSIY